MSSEKLYARLGEPLATRVRPLVEGAYDPLAALGAFDKAADALRDADLDRALPLLGPVLLASELVPRLLARRPGLVRWLVGSRLLQREKPLERYLREARAAVSRVPRGDPEALLRRLRRYKYRELLRIAVRDVSLQAPLPELGRELAHLAEGLVTAAVDACSRDLTARFGAPQPEGFGVLGLGKLGGEDLNLSSDIDLIYVYRDAGTTAGGPGGAIANAQYHARLSEAVTRAIGSATGEGFCFRVDLNLRPQGRSGPIASSLPQMLAYYEQFGRTWERAALLKARAVGGDHALCQELLEGLSPFIWRKSMDLSAVDGLRELKAQIDVRGRASQQDVKLGPGGIREVEFFANALQLLHGGKNAALRERNTLRALRKLEAAGLISGPDTDALEDAYVLLRRVENHLQLVEERQTQQLPSSDLERLRLARSLGHPSWQALHSTLERHRRFVLNAFRTLLGQTAREEVSEDPLLALALDPNAAQEERERALADRGFTSGDRAVWAIDRLGRIPESPFHVQGAGPSLQAIRLLGEIAGTPDPDQALLLFTEFIGGLRAPIGYLNLLAKLPRLSRRLMNLFGQSDFLSRYFLRNPELLDGLVQGTFDEAGKPLERLRAELSQRAGRYDDPEERLGVLRRFRNEEVLRIGLGDIGGDLDVPQVAAQLTALAEGVIDECLFLAQSELRERYGEPLTGRHAEVLSVIGMGKLGGNELGYHSDLDLIFVYSGAGQEETSGGSRGKITHHEYFAKLVQRLLAFLQMPLREGILYKTDARLRPSGNKGTLVVSQEAFRAHHQRHGLLWERQALVKARGAAGDLAFFTRLQAELIHPLVYERPLPPDAAQEIDRLRTRMEKELAQESASQLNAKTGHGGLVDVEFTVQYLQLAHGGPHPAVRSANTLEAIGALAQARRLTGEDARTLREGYLFHRRVENRLRLVHGHSLSLLPTHGRPLQLLARRLGYVGEDAGPRFLDEYRTYTGRVRDVYARLLRNG